MVHVNDSMSVDMLTATGVYVHERMAALWFVYEVNNNYF